ncbi:hypothetical protein GCM10009039_11310 [Halocalculus aciditolerans]|uniref:Uncharacterized protein n=1 Tax=Halocalculus aciditolerans TaxID=1383812 RepID=A0A830FA58_9EURY|nr:hypothetical protein GCM10009039_11310 [Halocalculus aciditolerans]
MLAGCSSGPTADGTIAETAAPATGTNRTTATQTTTAEPVPASAGSFDATLVRDTTDSHPPRVEATLTNESDAAFTLSGGYAPPFSASAARERAGDAALALYPIDEDARQYVQRVGANSSAPPSNRTNGCWRLDGSYAVAGIARMLTLSPGESASVTYDVYTSGDGACFPDGDYLAEHAARVSRGTHYDDATSTAWLYGFTLHVRDNTIASLNVEKITRAGGA